MKASHLSVLGINLFDVWFPPARAPCRQAEHDPPTVSVPDPVPGWIFWRWSSIVAHMQTVMPAEAPIRHESQPLP